MIMMHAFLHGVLMHVVEVIMSPLNPSEKYHLDTIQLVAQLKG